MVVIPKGLGIIGSQADRSARADPHIARGCRAPREFRNQLLVKTTATAIGAMRRSHGGGLQWRCPLLGTPRREPERGIVG
jgi:hypothetical protein